MFSLPTVVIISIFFFLLCIVFFILTYFKVTQLKSSLQEINAFYEEGKLANLVAGSIRMNYIEQFCDVLDSETGYRIYCSSNHNLEEEQSLLASVMDQFISKKRRQN